jgi:hypothetical protein
MIAEIEWHSSHKLSRLSLTIEAKPCVQRRVCPEEGSGSERSAAAIVCSTYLLEAFKNAHERLDLLPGERSSLVSAMRSTKAHLSFGVGFQLSHLLHLSLPLLSLSIRYYWGLWSVLLWVG